MRSKTKDLSSTSMVYLVEETENTVNLYTADSLRTIHGNALAFYIGIYCNRRNRSIGGQFSMNCKEGANNMTVDVFDGGICTTVSEGP